MDGIKTKQIDIFDLIDEEKQGIDSFKSWLFESIYKEIEEFRFKKGKEPSGIFIKYPFLDDKENKILVVYGVNVIIDPEIDAILKVIG